MGNHLVQKIGGIVSVKIFDRMIDRQTRELSRILQRTIVETGGPVRLLMVLETQLPASSPEALFESMQFVKLHSEFIERIAVIGRRTWEQTCIGLFSLFGGISMQYFDRSEIVEAVRWLHSGRLDKPKHLDKSKGPDEHKGLDKPPAANVSKIRKALLPVVKKLLAVVSKP